MCSHGYIGAHKTSAVPAMADDLIRNAGVILIQWEKNSNVLVARKPFENH